jgi:hypothetical protein
MAAQFFKKRKIIDEIDYNIETRKRVKRKRHFNPHDIMLNVPFLNLFTETVFGLHIYRVYPRELIFNLLATDFFFKF